MYIIMERIKMFANNAGKFHGVCKLRRLKRIAHDMYILYTDFISIKFLIADRTLGFQCDGISLQLDARIFLGVGTTERRR